MYVKYTLVKRTKSLMLANYATPAYISICLHPCIIGYVMLKFVNDLFSLHLLSRECRTYHQTTVTMEPIYVNTELYYGSRTGDRT